MQKDFTADLNQIQTSIKSINNSILINDGKMQMLDQQIESISVELVKISASGDLYSKCVELVILSQNTIKDSVKVSFEESITFALQHILGPEYKFVISFNKSGNNQETDFNIVSPELNQPYDPIETSGGGALDIASLALRIALLEWSIPKVCGPLLLDENFKHLSQNHRLAAAEFLKIISEKTGRQVLMVTHQDEFIEIANNKIMI